MAEDEGSDLANLWAEREGDGIMGKGEEWTG